MSIDKQEYRVTTVIRPPFAMFDPNTKKWSGLIVDYMETIASQLKIKYAFQETADKNYGYPDVRGKWNGMIGELVNKKADIAFGGLTGSSERATVVDFTEPFYDPVGFSVLIKRKEVKTKLWGWLTSLEVNVWLCIIAAYLVTSILIWIFDTWSPYAFRNRQHKYQDIEDSAKRFFTFKESLWYCFTSLTPQGGGDAPKCFSARLTSATWWLFGFIIIASYTANMAAHLALAKLEFSIDSYSDLTRQLRVQYSVVRNSAADHYYSRMANIELYFYDVWRNMTLNTSLSQWERAQLAIWEYPVAETFTKIHNHMEDAKLHNNILDAVTRVKFGRDSFDYAWIGEYPDVLYSTMLHCELKMLPDVISKRPYAIAVRKGSDLRQRINKVLYNLSSTDYLERLKIKWWDNNPEKKNCNLIDDSEPGLIYQNIGGLFMFIGLGIAIAFVTLILEFIYHCYLSKKLAKLGRYLDKKYHIIEKLDKLGITKLKRPCKLADPDVKSVSPTTIKESLEKEVQLQ